MKCLAKFFYAVFGIYAGFQFATQAWTPLLTYTPHEEVSFSQNKSDSFSHINETNKRAFFRTLYETFESENPRSENLDSAFSPRPSDEELRHHYARFDHLLMRVRANGCPTKQVTVPSRYDDMDAIDRVFDVFDVKQCH